VFVKVNGKDFDPMRLASRKHIPADLADNRRGIDQALSRPMKCLDVLLFDRLARNERDAWLARRRADRSASFPSLLRRRTNGFTYCGLTIFTGV
jgi:hypothetical protein